MRLDSLAKIILFSSQSVPRSVRTGVWQFGVRDRIHLGHVHFVAIVCGINPLAAGNEVDLKPKHYPQRQARQVRLNKTTYYLGDSGSFHCTE